MSERFCKVCRGWHDLEEPWPHNCLPAYNHARSDLATPMLIRDIPEYRSPIDGKLITSRSTRREDLKANDCVEWEPGISQKACQQGRVPGKYSNPNFALKRGLPLSEQGQAKLKEMKKSGQL